MLPPFPTDEPMKFLGGIFRLLPVVELAAPCHHLLGGKPDTKIHELNEPGAVGPPEQTELLDGEKKKPPCRLFCLQFPVFSCGHVASLVWRGQGSGVRFSREGSAILGQTSPLRLTIGS